MSIESFLFQHSIWVVAIVMGSLNVGLTMYRIRRMDSLKPVERQAMTKLAVPIQLSMVLPFLVMGLGCTIGGVPGAFHFFRPQDMDPFVLAFFGSIALAWLVLVYLIIIKNGAKLVVEYPEIFRWSVRSPRMLKLVVAVSILGGFGAAIVAVLWDIPVDRFNF